LAQSVKSLLTTFTQKQAITLTSVETVYAHCDHASKKLAIMINKNDSTFYFLNVITMML
jgi:hypothetical protein